MARKEAVLGGVDAIAQASRAQSEGMAQAHAAVAQMAGGARDNALLMDEAGAAASPLRRQTQALLRTVRRFIIDELPAPALPSSTGHRGARP
ncbi:hypothetical protein [Acidovorax sp.]|uniref:hypothetical protein n=1 Tax=Acidovorax sp. TaxID=1872122 RepID=UPI002ACE14F0|nr:hypothetical protein [Acidovorax sp.]MDZ7863246.1 hypothetical protein [Acidovorax sp.]